MTIPDFTEKVDVVELSTGSVMRQIVGNIAFIVPDVTNLTDEETKIKIEIEKKYNLYLFSNVDSGNIDFSNFSLVLLSTGLTLSDLDDLIHIEKPIITLDATHPNQLLDMTSNATTDSSEEIQIDIQTIEQQMIAGAGITATGYTTIYSGSDTLDGVALAGVAGIINLAVKAGTAYSCLCVLERGVFNASGVANPDIRMFFGLLSADKLNSTGLDILLQAILYAGCMASSISHSTYELLKKLEEIEYKVGFRRNFPLGKLYFVAKTGVDTARGTSWAKAKLTIDAGVGCCTADNNDYVFVNQGSYNENVNVGGVIADVHWIHLIGGDRYKTQVANSNASASSVFNITGTDVEIAGFYIYEVTNTVEGIVGLGNRAHINNNVFEGTMENAIHIQAGVDWLVENNYITGTTNDGIELSGGAHDNTIRYNNIFEVGDYGIHLRDVTEEDNFIYDNRINGHNGTTDVGIYINNGINNIITNNWIGECATSPTFDSGSNNIWLNNHIDKISGSFNITAAQTTTLTDQVSDIDLPTGGKFVVRFDVATLIANESTKTVTFTVYVKVDGTNYQVADFKTFKAGTDTIHPKLEFESEGGAAKAKIASQMDSTSSGTRAIPYRIIPVGE